ncbi:MAG: 16S rRNA (cytosine(1402)-N(4))-methyltransferase RsmH [bacterium]
MQRDDERWHVPVMVEEVKRFLIRDSTRAIVDMTAGTGGHLLELAKAAPEDCRIVGLDLDSDALGAAEGRLQTYKDRVTLRRANFKDVLDAVPSDLVGRVDAALVDCGISRLEIVTTKRGFSFDREDSLDMRFDISGGQTAETYLGGATVDELARLFWQYGERGRSRRIARAVVAQRDRGEMSTTSDLARAVKSVVRAKQASSLARVFLAVRATVNKETENLTRAIEALPTLLAAGGRACIISYHSVEDRVVKTLFNRNSGKCVCPPCSEVCSCGKTKVFKILTPKPLVPTREEIASNPSARSAKLRVAEKM